MEDHPHSDSTVPVSGTSRAPADFVSSDSESTSVDVLEEDAVVHTCRQEVPIEQSVDNRKITFSPPSTSSDIHQPTEEQQQQLVAMFPEHPSSTISTVLELMQLRRYAEGCRYDPFTTNTHCSSAKAKR